MPSASLCGGRAMPHNNPKCPMCSPRPSYKGAAVSDKAKARAENLAVRIQDMIYTALAEWNREDEAARAAKEERDA